MMPQFSLMVVQPPRVARGTPRLLLKARHPQTESAADRATNVKAIKPQVIKPYQTSGHQIISLQTLEANA
jgi:hypothetical protein